MSAHCGELDPTGTSVAAGDLDPMGLLDQEILGDVVIDGGTGQITNARSAGLGVINGIDFGVRGQLTIFRFKSVTFRGQVALRGVGPIAIVADGAITFEDVVDARGTCSSNAQGPGGSPGGNSAETGSGSGGGGRGTNAGTTAVSGGGGGAHGADGSKGGDGGSSPGGVGGNAFGDPQITTLVGGSGGGGGGRGDGGVGGGGGGALFLVSNTEVRIITIAGINAGGCGGREGTGSFGGGGGGGAGGAILIEAPTVVLAGGLAVNGGGGGSGVGGTDGENAKLSVVAAPGGVGLLSGGGGRGGATNEPGGQPGIANAHAGGGGGAVGRIRINTRTGNAQITGFTSPSLDAPGSTSTMGTALVR